MTMDEDLDEMEKRLLAERRAALEKNGRLAYPPDDIPLYTCGTAACEMVVENPGAIEFYTNVEALKHDLSCTEECGIIEIRSKWRVHTPGKRKKGITTEELQAKQGRYIPLAEKIVQDLAGVDTETAISALTWALGAAKRQR